MISSNNKKCKGCGNTLTSDKDRIGYTPDLDFKYCQRCFKLTNYKHLDNKQDAQQIAADNLQEFDFNDNYIYMIVDIFNITDTLIQKYKDYDNVVILVNKIDLLQKRFNYQVTLSKAKEIIEKNGFDNVFDVILCSTKNNFGIQKIRDSIYKSNIKKKIFFVGKTNVGKSSLLNSLLDQVDSFYSKLTTSNFSNTTLDFKKIKILNHIVIDCPGEQDEHNITNLLTSKQAQAIVNSNKVKTFQIRKQCLIFIEKLLCLEIANFPDLVGSVTFYLGNLAIHKTNINNYQKIIDNKIIFKYDLLSNDNVTEYSYTLESEKKYNISIPGLGLISVKNIEKIKITMPKNVNIYLEDIAII